MAKLQIPIPDETMARAKAAAALKKLTLGAFVVKLIERATKEQK